MSILEIEATSNKEILKLEKNMSSLEPKAVDLLGTNTIYCFKKYVHNGNLRGK